MENCGCGPSLLSWYPVHKMAAVRHKTATSTDRYVGGKRKQLRHGYGVYRYENTFFRYEGQWENGHKHGHGKLLLGNGGHYEGTFVKGEIEGHGYRVFGVSGNIYTGQFLGGELHGQGLLRTPSGEQYEGDFIEGRKEGFGTLTEKNGACYEGEFHGNRRHGEGSQVYANGNQYKGDWVGGQRHGQGTLKSTDGTIYEGQWRGGVYHGQGTLSHCSGASYTGMWANDMPTGKAVAVRLVTGGGSSGSSGAGELIVIQGDRFNVHFECVDANGTVADSESGMSFKITAAIQKKSTTGNEDTTPYELLQLPHSTENSQWTSETTSRPDSSHHPPLPLQLGRLTSELYRLHSSSTHSLNTVTSFQDRRGSVDSTTAKSLQNLDKFADEDSTSLDAYTQPSISVTNRGKGSFQELFLPPPIIPLPKTKKKATLRSSSRNMTANHSGRVTPNCKKGSRTPTPEQQHSNKPQSNMQSNYEDPNLASTPSLSHVAEKGHMTSGSRSSMAMEGSTETSCHSNVVQKLLQKRAKFCTPGTYILTLTEVTSPPFLGELLPALHIEVHVVSSKTSRQASISSHLFRSTSRPPETVQH